MLLPFVLIVSCFLSFSNGAENCPLFGPLFPKPLSLATSATMQAAFKNLTTVFTNRDADNSTGALTNSYSLEIFSASDPTPIFQHSHTASNLADVNTEGGVSQVDGDTVFRIGSLTKIFTIFTFLVEDGDQHFSSPITKFIPELAAIAQNTSGNAITRVPWEDITIGELASHLAGITADSKPNNAPMLTEFIADGSGSLLGEITQQLGSDIPLEIGFPPLPAAEIPPCGTYVLCNRTEFFAAFSHYLPAFAPSETPAYSNIAFQLLSYALETITGRDFQTSLQTKVLDPLGLIHTFYTTPNASLGVLPGNTTTTEWLTQLGDESPAGMMYSSASDIGRLGRAILSSTLLAPALTRRWFEPATLTSDIRETVGYPWGIRRIIMDPAKPYELITAYNKAGTIGGYSGLISLLPEFDVGISITVAGDLSLNNWVIADNIGNSLLPALQQAAIEYAAANYAGNYSSPTLNSSITFAVDSSKPGIGISSWISNGTDMMAIASLLALKTISPNFGARLYPTDLEAKNSDGTKQVVLKALFENLGTQTGDASTRFMAACGTWIGPTAFVYGGLALDEFIFTLDKSGKASSVEVSALRLPMARSSS